MHIACLARRWCRSDLSNRKNADGIPPFPKYQRRTSFAPVTSSRWQGLFMGLRTDLIFTQAMQRPWQRQISSWCRIHLRDGSWLFICTQRMSNRNLGGGYVFSSESPRDCGNGDRCFGRHGWETSVYAAEVKQVSPCNSQSAAGVIPRLVRCCLETRQ